jgi:hypothetical protein
VDAGEEEATEADLGEFEVVDLGTSPGVGPKEKKKEKKTKGEGALVTSGPLLPPPHPAVV